MTNLLDLPDKLLSMDPADVIGISETISKLVKSYNWLTTTPLWQVIEEGPVSNDAISEALKKTMKSDEIFVASLNQLLNTQNKLLKLTQAINELGSINDKGTVRNTTAIFNEYEWKFHFDGKTVTISKYRKGSFLKTFDISTLFKEEFLEIKEMLKKTNLEEFVNGFIAMYYSMLYEQIANTAKLQQTMVLNIERKNAEIANEKRSKSKVMKELQGLRQALRETRRYLYILILLFTSLTTFLFIEPLFYQDKSGSGSPVPSADK